MWSMLLLSVAKNLSGRAVIMLKNFNQRFAVTLSYQILGNDQKYFKGNLPIFLLHDILGSKKEWSMTGEVLHNLTKRPVVTVDMRNHGNSPHASTHQYEEMAKDMLALFDKMGIERASLVGLGMGGRASMTLALMTPQRVASMLVIEISPVSSPHHLLNVVPEILLTLQKIDFKGDKNVRDSRKKVKQKLTDLVTDDASMNVVLENIRVMKDKGNIGWACNLEVIINSFDHIKAFPPSQLGKVYTGPVLFIGGQHSEYIPPDDLPLILELFPRAVIMYIPESGHNVQHDHPKRFLELATKFLKQEQDLRNGF